MNPETINVENSVGPSFEVVQGDSMFVPFGRYEHKAGLQILNDTAVDRMARALSGLVGKLIPGLKKRSPIYIGHPDVPGRGAEFPDKKAYGWIEHINTENDGMRLGVRWTDEGRKLIEGGHFLYYSPYWEAERTKGGLLPVRLISVGLTNNPNIPVPAIANDGTGAAPSGELEFSQVENDETMKKELAELLGKDDGTSEADLLAEVKRLRDAAEEEIAEEKEEAEEDAAEEAAEAANDALVAIREQRAGAAVDVLCLSGKLTVAQREDATRELLACENEADYATKLDSLANGQVTLKTEAVTDGLAENAGKVHLENDAAVRKQKRAELIDAEMLRNGGNFQAAWNKVQRKEPGLFA